MIGPEMGATACSRNGRLWNEDDWQAIEAKKLGPVLDERRAQFLNWPPTLAFRSTILPSSLGLQEGIQGLSMNSQSTSPLPSIWIAFAAAIERSVPALFVLRPVMSIPGRVSGPQPVSQYGSLLSPDPPPTQPMSIPPP